MPKPSDAQIQALPNDLRFQYQQFLEEDEDGAIYERFNRKAQERIEAQQKIAEEQLMLERIQQGDMQNVPQIVQDVLDVSESIGGVGEKDFSRFTPGFEKFITTPDTPLAQETVEARLPELKGDITDLQLQAYKDAEQYYRGQGFLSDAEAKQASVEEFVRQYGSKQEYINNQIAAGSSATPETLGFLYDQGYNIANEPPGGFPNTAEAMAKKQVYGETQGRDTFGPLNAPIQPRRYAQFGDMAPVGPRTDPGTAQVPIIRSLRDMSPKEAQASISALGLPFRGASPVAEEFRQNPQRAAEMSPMALAREAFRPQVVKTGEQKRIEREQQARKADFLIAQVEDIQKEQPELSQKEAILEFAQQVEDQSFDLLVQQGMKEKLTPEYVRQYKMRDPISAGALQISLVRCGRQ